MIQRSPIPSAAMDSTSCAPWPTTGVSKAITTAGPSGPPSTGPARDGHHAQQPGPAVDHIANGQRIRELRRQCGLAQAELAGLAGVSLDTVARLERQHRTACRTRTLARIPPRSGSRPQRSPPSFWGTPG